MPTGWVARGKCDCNCNNDDNDIVCNGCACVCVALWSLERKYNELPRHDADQYNNI